MDTDYNHKRNLMNQLLHKIGTWGAIQDFESIECAGESHVINFFY